MWARDCSSYVPKTPSTLIVNGMISKKYLLEFVKRSSNYKFLNMVIARREGSGGEETLKDWELQCTIEEFSTKGVSILQKQMKRALNHLMKFVVQLFVVDLHGK